MKLHRYVDHQRLHIVTKDVISLSISVLLLFRHYLSHKITFGAPSSGGVLCSACGAFIYTCQALRNCSLYRIFWHRYMYGYFFKMYSFNFFPAGKALEVSKKHLEQLSELDELQALGKTLLHANSKGCRPACASPRSGQGLC